MDFVNNNHDCTNAFCCTTLEACDQVCTEILGNDTDVEFGKQRHRWSSMTVQAREDRRDPCNQLCMRPQQGNLQGDTQAVHSFPRAFREPIHSWNYGHLPMYRHFDGSGPNDHAACYTNCPQTGKLVDTTLTKYADDLVKTIIGPRHLKNDIGSLEGLFRRAEASSGLLSTSLEDYSYAQNTDKLLGVFGTFGPGAHAKMRTVQANRTTSYKLHDSVKSLGCMVDSSGSFQHERRARVDAVLKAQFQLGGRIKLSSIPYKLKRIILIGRVLNVAISGLEAYVLTDGDYQVLQTPVVKILRKAMGKKGATLEWSEAQQEMVVTRQAPNAVVLRYWKIPTLKIELMIRRICMYQTMALHPEDSILLMATAFGKIRAKTEAGIGDPVSDSYTTDDATPWAGQFRDDLRTWFPNK